MVAAKRPSDHDQRQKAVFAPEHAFVWAGAGTGKTTVLTLRALYLILKTLFSEPFGNETGPLHEDSERRMVLTSARRAIRSVVLITFTRKAAAEMKSRLFSYLDALAVFDERDFRARFESEMELLVEVVDRILEEIKSTENADGGARSPYERLQAAARALAELAPELQVSTIHSYAARILRRNPLEARLPKDVVFADEDNLLQADVAERLVDRWIDRVALRDNRLQETLATVLRWMDLEQVRNWLALIHHNRWVVDQLLQWKAGLPDVDTTRLAAAFRQIDAHIQIGNGSHVIRRVHGQWMEFTGRLERGDDSAWVDLALPALDLYKNYFGSTTVKNASAGQEPEIRKLLQDKTRWQATVYGHAMSAGLETTWEAWVALVDGFLKWSRGAEVRELKVVTFDEIIKMAARLLRTHGRVRRRERQGLAALLMDEFQDTDPDQIELVKHLLLEDAEVPNEVKGFFVGDLKQSIYRFRHVDLAHVHQFHDVCLTAWNDRVQELELKTNFRSRSDILAFVNSGFEPLFQLEPGVQCDHQNLRPYRDHPDDPVPAPDLIDVDPERVGRDRLADVAKELASEQVVRRIREHVGTARDRYREIMVLVRNNSDLEVLLPLLAEAGIPAISSGTKTYYGNPEVLDLLNLLIVLHNPDDTVAVAGLLRSPMVCISDTDFHTLVSNQDLSDCFRPGQDIDLSFLPGRAQRRIHQIKQLAKQRRIHHIKLLAKQHRTDPLEIWLQRVHEFVPWPLYSPKNDLEGRFFLRFKTLFRNYRDIVTTGIEPPLKWLLQQRRRAVGAGDWGADLGEDVVATDEAVNAVRVMTIHKAKGLEEKYVIVFGWAHAVHAIDKPKPDKRSGIRSAYQIRDGRLEPVRGVRRDWGALKIETADYSAAEALEKRQVAAEAVRLAYVAATRARDRLTLLVPRYGHLKLGDRALVLCGLKEGVPPPQALEIQTAVPLEQIGPETPQPARPEIATKEYVSRWKKLRDQCTDNMAAKLLDKPTAFQRSPTESAPAVDRPAGAASSEVDRIRGNLVHAYLERHVTDDAFNRAVLDSLARTSETPVPDLAVEATASILEAFFKGALKDNQGQAYRDRISKGRVLGREVPFYLTFKDQAWNGKIDLILEEKGTILVVDYKTGVPLDAESEERRYGKQQEIYTEAVQRLFKDRTVDFEIFWLGT